MSGITRQYLLSASLTVSVQCTMYIISSQYVENASREYVENADLCLRIHATRSLYYDVL